MTHCATFCGNIYGMSSTGGRVTKDKPATKHKAVTKASLELRIAGLEQQVRETEYSVGVMVVEKHRAVEALRAQRWDFEQAKQERDAALYELSGARIAWHNAKEELRNRVTVFFGGPPRPRFHSNSDIAWLPSVYRPIREMQGATIRVKKPKCLLPWWKRVWS